MHHRFHTFKGVLFDFDGTLADTMGDHYNAWAAVLFEYGFQLKREDYYPLEGMRVPDLAAHWLSLLNHLNKDGDRQLPTVEDIVRKKDAHYLKHHALRFFEGVEELIDSLKNEGIKIAIVTAARSHRLEKSVSSNFLKKFNAIVTGDLVTHPKPHPESYLKGAELLGLDPSVCLAIENAPLGVQSAKSAGMRCFAVCSTNTPEVLKDADEIFASIQSLQNWF